MHGIFNEFFLWILNKSDKSLLLDQTLLREILNKVHQKDGSKFTEIDSVAEIRQAVEASRLLLTIKDRKEKIVTCNEQIYEIISAIQKYKMREYNRNCKKEAKSGVGSLKEFRAIHDFAQVQSLCRSVCEDIYHLAINKGYHTFILDEIQNNLHLVDINDVIYYDYCIRNEIFLYTFDGDFAQLEPSRYINII